MCAGVSWLPPPGCSGASALARTLPAGPEAGLTTMEQDLEAQQLSFSLVFFDKTPPAFNLTHTSPLH